MTKFASSISLSLLFSFFTLALVPATATDWKAAVAKVDITPTEEIWLAGYGGRDRPVSEVSHRIWVKALALQDETGRVSVLVTSDLLGFTSGLSKRVADRVQSRHGISRAGLAFNASHTHSAPVVGGMLRPAYKLGSEHVPAIERYTQKLEDQVVEAIDNAIAAMEPATLSFEQGLAGFADHPLTGEIAGIGLVGVVELVADKAPARPFDPQAKIGAYLAGRAEEHGLIVRGLGDRVAFSPPLIISEAEIDEMLARFGRALEDTARFVAEQGLA